MARVSILMMPEPGHYLPTLRIAQTLRLRGNTVCYATLPYFEAFFRRQGFEIQTIAIPGLPECDKGDIFSTLTINRVVRKRLSEHLVDTKRSLREFLRQVISTTECDLLICDSTFGESLGPIAGELSRHVVFMNVTLPTNDGPSGYPNHHELVLCPYALEMPATSAHMTNRLYGEPSIYRQRLKRCFPWHELEDSKPMVYCSFGSQAAGYPLAADTLQCVVKACAYLPAIQFVLVVDSFHQLKLSAIPKNVIVVESAPQPELLDLAAAFITHGGLGSVKEAIMAKVPMVIIPFSVDQPSNAKRVEYHRLGYGCMPQDCSPQRLADLVIDVTSNGEIGDSLRAMNELFTKTEDEAPALRFIEDLLLE